MIVCTCNVRGLNNPAKLGEIKNFMGKHQISLMALLETRVKIHNKDKILKKFGNRWNWVHNYEASDRGECGLFGILLL